MLSAVVEPITAGRGDFHEHGDGHKGSRYQTTEVQSPSSHASGASCLLTSIPGFLVTFCVITGNYIPRFCSPFGETAHYN